MDSVSLILNIILFLTVVILIAVVIKRTSANRRNDTGHEIEEKHRNDELLKAIGESHRREMEEMRTRYAEQRSEMKEDFNNRLAEIRMNFDRQRDDDRQRHKEEMETLRRETLNQYKTLSQEVLSANAESLKQQNNDQMETIMRPLKDRLEQFNKLVMDSYGKENASRQSLCDQVTKLIELNRTIGEEARNLTLALKADPKQQGDWGENILETLLEEAGLEKGIHFNVQVTRNERGEVLRNEEGKGQRPDVVVNLPDSRKLVIDSKVSLTAFTEYHACDDPEQRKILARRHLDSVRKHINELANASYQKTIENSADHLLMFIPMENAYLLAMQTDRDLWKYAYDRHIAIVSPTHLLSVMHIISQLWTQDSQNRNVLKIAEEGGKLYDKLSRFCEEFIKIDKSLESTRKAYDDAFKHLTTGRGNVISRAENLRGLGAKVSKTIPSRLTESSDVDDNFLPPDGE